MIKFYGIPVVWIRLSNSVTDEDLKLRRELDDFLWENDIIPAVRSGGAASKWSSGGYSPLDARKIIDWLKEHGAEVDPSILIS